eukprot:13044766-Ditylum_brightwellii.AAC.1
MPTAICYKCTIIPIEHSSKGCKKEICAFCRDKHGLQGCFLCIVCQGGSSSSSITTNSGFDKISDKSMATNPAKKNHPINIPTFICYKYTIILTEHSCE